MTWEEAARQLNVPADRMLLVKRNLELKDKLEARGRAIRMWMEAWHEIFKHEGTYADCRHDSCIGSRDILQRTEP